MKYLSENGLAYLVQKIKIWLGEKVDKIEGKGLSTNDYTAEEKTKLSGIEEKAEVNTIEVIKVNNVTSTITNKEVNIIVPTKTSELTNDSKYQTETDVETAIKEAVSDVSGADLSNYYSKDEMNAITNAEIDTICV